MSTDASLLDGIRVLEVATFVFGPAAGTVLGDFGADVVKVEHPATGDPYRYLHQLAPRSCAMRRSHTIRPVASSTEASV